MPVTHCQRIEILEPCRSGAISHECYLGGHRIRHYGLLASAARKANIARVTELLAAAEPQTAPAATTKAAAATTKAAAAAPTDHRPPCPCCGGRMIVVETFERGGGPPSSDPGVETA